MARQARATRTVSPSPSSDGGKGQGEAVLSCRSRIESPRSNSLPAWPGRKGSEFVYLASCRLRPASARQVAVHPPPPRGKPATAQGGENGVVNEGGLSDSEKNCAASDLTVRRDCPCFQRALGMDGGVLVCNRIFTVCSNSALEIMIPPVVAGFRLISSNPVPINRARPAR